MAIKRIKKENKIKTYSIGLRPEQIKWINKHPEFNINKFARDQLNKYIQLKNEVDQFGKETIR
mgnify:CR=1 FL=1